MTKKKSSAAFRIPEEHQKDMRKRLRMLRESRDIQKIEVKTLTAGTLVNYEEHDISSARVGDLFKLAEEYGVEPQDLITYLFGESYEIDLTPYQRRLRSMEAYLTSLDEAHQELAVDLIQRLVTHTVDQRRQVTPVPQKPQTVTEADSKQIVKAALAEARWQERHEAS